MKKTITTFVKSIRVGAMTSALLLMCSYSQALDMEGAAPDFTLKTNSGDNLKLSEQAGDVVMINFWASWCGPCREEMPLLEGLYQEYKDLGFTILGVNIDEESANAQTLLSQVNVNFPILFDPQSSISELYQVDAMPSTVLVDRDGNMRFMHRGYREGYIENYEAQIKQLVME